MKMKNITEFLTEHKDTVFRFLTYNVHSIWTPNQQFNKYIDDSIYTDTHYSFAKITDAIDTPDGVLLELDMVDEDDFISYNRKEYRLLGDIELSMFECDNQEELPFEDEEEPF